jgi:hypothetical protein|nr:MAG TPA: hypothetical protein [Caudoviricetes sp.]
MASTTIFRLRFNRNYTTFVKTGRGIVKVDFTPIVLFGRTENSQFGTADPEVVKGLKKHRDFGSLFFIEEEGNPAPAAANAAAEADAAEADAAEGAGTETDKEEAGGSGPEDSLMHEKSVTSKNKAIAYLLEKHGATFAQTADIAAMKEEARSVYNLVFDNWK